MSLKAHLCNFCKQTFPSRNQLFKHIKYDHENEVNISSSSVIIKRKLDCTESDDSDDDNNKSSNIKLPLEIKTVQEDENWYRVIIKPPGLSTMGEKLSETVLNSDQMFIPNRTSFKKAVPCHRLDKLTGGLLICSKSREAHGSIVSSFEKREIFKRYRAIVIGRLEPTQGQITLPISGQHAETKYEIVCYTKSHQHEWITTIDLWPLTGRRHQLRKHLKELGHPIINDPKYCQPKYWCTVPQFENMMFLWALELKFPHKGSTSTSTSTSNTENDLITDNINEHSSIDDSIYKNNCELLNGYPLISIIIDEPTYYEEFRRFQSTERINL